MGTVKRLVDKQIDTKLKQETDLCFKKIKALEIALKMHREKLKELLEGSTEELAEELGIIKGKTGETVSVLYLLERTNELIEDTVVLWGEGVRKNFWELVNQS
jgi:hypothetical protein